MARSFGKSDAERYRMLHDVATVEPLLRAGATAEIDTRAPLDEVVDALERIVDTVGRLTEDHASPIRPVTAANPCGGARIRLGDPRFGVTDGASMESRARNLWQRVANQTRPKTAVRSRNRCRGSRLVADPSAWQGRGRLRRSPAPRKRSYRRANGL
jgi:hypothetical protein